MDRFLLIEWMDAVAPLWAGEDYNGQMFIDRWWWDLFEALKNQCLDGTPMMVYQKAKVRS